MRHWKQVGVDYVLMGGPKSPWEEAGLRSIMDSFTSKSFRVVNMKIGGIDDVIRGNPGAYAQNGHIGFVHG